MFLPYAIREIMTCDLSASAIIMSIEMTRKVVSVCWAMDVCCCKLLCPRSGIRICYMQSASEFSGHAGIEMNALICSYRSCNECRFTICMLPLSLVVGVISVPLSYAALTLTHAAQIQKHVEETSLKTLKSVKNVKR